MINKLILIVLVITMCLGLLPICVSATSEDVSEFQEMIYTAYQIYYYTQIEEPFSSVHKSFMYEKENEHAICYESLDETRLYGGSLDAWNTAVDELYSEVAAKKLRRAYLNPNAPLFVEKEGEMFIAWGPGGGQRMPFEFLYGSANEIELISFVKNENTASAKIKVEIPGAYWGDPDTEAYVSCNFEYSNRKWRIVDCPFVDMMTSYNYEWTPVESPSTGDGAAERATLLGVVSLACAIPAACLMRRRRRQAEA